MARLRRTWRILKWAGAVSLLSVGGGIAISVFYTVYLGNPVWQSLLIDGRLHISYEQHPIPPDSFRGDRADYESLSLSSYVEPNESSMRDWYWLPGDPKYDAEWQWQRWEVQMPLWIPGLLIGAPTVVLFWLDRRRIPPGHCRNCGYNLTGNVSGICPECGERA